MNKATTALFLTLGILAGIMGITLVNGAADKLVDQGCFWPHRMKRLFRYVGLTTLAPDAGAMPRTACYLVIGKGFGQPRQRG